MNFDHLHYIPCLRWKLGEYQAISRLLHSTKRRFTPLIEVPEIGWDFENKTEAKTIDEHLKPFAKRVHEKWGVSPCFVDLSLIKPNEKMATGTHPVRFVFDGLRAKGCRAIPVIGLIGNTKYPQEIKKILTKDKRGVCFRVSIEKAAKNTFVKEIDSLLLKLEIESNNCDLILDLDAPSFVPLEGFSMVIQQIVNKLPYLNDWRTFTLLGTSFPETMASIKRGGEIVPRYEWQLYKKLIGDLKKAELRLPAFGDYAISHPTVLELDMRIIKPSATIRYTIDDGWLIVKGKNVRDEKFGKFTQYRDLSKKVVSSRYYCGQDFSWGDKYIFKCADGSGKTGHLPMWRQVGTNHHIEKVILDIANFYAS